MKQPFELVKEADSKYSLVVAVAKRARAIAEKGGDLPKSTKPVTLALQEVASGKLKFRRPVK